MTREWVPLVGLFGLVLAGGVLTFGLMSQPDMAPPQSHAPVVSTEGSTEASSSKMVFKTPVQGRVAAPDGALNVVWLVACSVRQDVLSPYGGPEELTPNWASLSQSGIRMADPIAAAPWSRASVAAMLTGRHAIEMGFVDAGQGASEGRLANDVVTLPEHLAQRGWYTMAVNSNPLMRHDTSGIWQGVDHLWDAHPKGWQAEHRAGHEVVLERALRMLHERPKDRPFFLQLVVSDSHKPVRVRPPEYNPFEDVAVGMAPYAATVRRTDDVIGRVLKHLEQSEELDNTLLVVVTDHGEGLGRPAHHGPAHGRFLAPSVARMAWLMRGPGLPSGATVEGVVSGVDVAPTVAGLLGTTDFPSTEGLDLSKAIRGEQPNPRQVAYIDTWYHNANRAAVYGETAACQADFGSVGLEDAFEPGCFDRIEDPEHNTVVENDWLTVSLNAWRAGHADSVQSVGP